ncbi:MAG: hypothetical protein AB7J34_02920, partial [Limisphaerales bacterium]
FDPSGRLETFVAGPEQLEPVGSVDRDPGGEDPAMEALDVAVAGDGRVAVLNCAGSEVHLFRRKGTASNTASV